MIGRTIAYYKILEKLGEGGMGVVYRAHDEKLDRPVALKFLPERVIVSAQEKARFLQEARAASAVTHANVCVIHDIAEHGNQQFIVMEYVEGKTLRQMVPVGKMQDAIAYAIQIGEALQEAHSKGVVHRDIKTDNIMVNTKNQVKVMDFGLAKLKGTLKLTKTTSTVGTLAYMAPEQIQGGEVDARSDIFSFGVVLYEMLTGHLPFPGEHEAAMVYSIVNEEPVAIQQYLPDISSELVHILSRALEKDPEDRYQSVHDMVIDLRRLKKETTKVIRRGEYVVPPSKIGEELPVGRLRRVWLWLIIGAIAISVGMLTYLLMRGPELNPDMKFRVLQIPFRNVWYADMSQDGNWIVFPAADDRGRFDIYMMNVSQGVPRRVTNDSCNSIFGVSLSPDVSTILYSRDRPGSDFEEIKIVSSLGGEGRVIVDSGYSVGWLPDGQRVQYTLNRRLPQSRQVFECWTCKPDGSDRRLELADTVGVRRGLRQAFVYSLDGKSVAWTKNFPEGYSEIMIRDLEKSTDRQLTFDKKFADDPLWTPSGHIIYSSNRSGNLNLWVVPATGGESIQLTRGSGPDVPRGITADGKRLMYSEIQDIGHIQLANLVDGSLHQLTVDDRSRGVPSISPSGQHIAFPMQEFDEVSTTLNIYVMDRDGANVRKLTDDINYKSWPSWSPDEKSLVYCARLGSEPPESSMVYLIKADKPGRPKKIGNGEYVEWYDEREFVLWRSQTTYKGSIDRPDHVKFSEDSILAIPVLDQEYVLMADWHKRHEGWWITPIASYEATGIAKAKQLYKWFIFASLTRGGSDMFYVAPDTRKLHRISLPDGKDELVKKTIPGLGIFFDVSDDGKEIVYTESLRRTRFVIIENVFK